MNCRKCSAPTKVIDTRTTEATHGVALTRRADQLFEDCDVRVRRRECKKCKKKFDTFEISVADVLKYIKK